ncbi:MAG: hypothetical protein QOD87_1224 [Pseudonocardiales bacterium]|nr:hypothetical protein [Pseudonocardiales bacterium]
MTVTCAGRAVAAHDRCWARHQSITDAEHRAAAEALRKYPKPPRRPAINDVEQRPLSDYDQIFGLAEEVA